MKNGAWPRRWAVFACVLMVAGVLPVGQRAAHGAARERRSSKRGGLLGEFLRVLDKSGTNKGRPSGRPRTGAQTSRPNTKPNREAVKAFQRVLATIGMSREEVAAALGTPSHVTDLRKANFTPLLAGANDKVVAERVQQLSGGVTQTWQYSLSGLNALLYMDGDKVRYSSVSPGVDNLLPQWQQAFELRERDSELEKLLVAVGPRASDGYLAPFEVAEKTLIGEILFSGIPFEASRAFDAKTGKFSEVYSRKEEVDLGQVRLKQVWILPRGWAPVVESALASMIQQSGYVRLAEREQVRIAQAPAAGASAPPATSPPTSQTQVGEKQVGEKQIEEKQVKIPRGMPVPTDKDDDYGDSDKYQWKEYDLEFRPNNSIAERGQGSPTRLKIHLPCTPKMLEMPRQLLSPSLGVAPEMTRYCGRVFLDLKRPFNIIYILYQIQGHDGVGQPGQLPFEFRINNLEKSNWGLLEDVTKDGRIGEIDEFRLPKKYFRFGANFSWHALTADLASGSNKVSVVQVLIRVATNRTAILQMQVSANTPEEKAENLKAVRRIIDSVDVTRDGPFGF